MIKLEYNLDKSWDQPSLDWSSADETALRYSAFTGDQVFTVGEVDFSARWGWVPILDFAVSLRGIARSLKEGAIGEAFSFTESEAELSFLRDGQSVSIAANYVDAKTVVPLSELVQATEAYAATVLNEAAHQHPALSQNPVFGGWSGS